MEIKYYVKEAQKHVALYEYVKTSLPKGINRIKITLPPSCEIAYPRKSSEISGGELLHGLYLLCKYDRNASLVSVLRGNFDKSNVPHSSNA
jgi:hypothetical protein